MSTESLFDSLLDDADTKTAEAEVSADVEQAAAESNGNGSKAPGWEKKVFADEAAVTAAGYVTVGDFAFNRTQANFKAAEAAKEKGNGNGPTPSDMVTPTMVTGPARSKTWKFPIIYAVNENGIEIGTFVHEVEGAKAWATKPEGGTSNVGGSKLSDEELMKRYGQRRAALRKAKERFHKDDAAIKARGITPEKALEYYESTEEAKEAEKAISDDE